MTENEAKKYMLIEKECINRDCDRDCANCDIVQNAEDLNNAYDIAIKALEKQIPNEPIIDACCLFTSYTCPVCRHEVEVSDYYCRCCGQKIRKTTNN